MVCPQRRTAFTLIELLVVMAIISLLISILLPALSGARRQGQATVCLSNIKQTSLALFLYSLDNNGIIPGTYWQGTQNLDWSGRDNTNYLNNPQLYRHPMEASVMARYISMQDRILECPGARREANGWFDYTMIIRMAGAKTDLCWEMTYPINPAEAQSPRRSFLALPLLVEEDSRFYNSGFNDGSWANLDQLTDRHTQAANIAYIDGSATRFLSPKGPDPEREEPGDLKAQHLRLLALRHEYPVWESDNTEFGWVNKPH
jgi:prepilin-type N-terminal cleavage/methylation domain-containing protein/prepilin-type processing-associated H-X9-DG protein